MENKVKMKRHESFSIREGWLAKGLKSFIDNNKVFSDYNSTDILGIGSNMVKSLKYWMIATKLIEENGRSLQLTKFGQLLYNYDPYLEEDFSWWLIHINLIMNNEDAYVFNCFFNKCLQKSFTKKDIFDQISNDLNSHNINYSTKILQDEISVILKTYSIDDTIDNPENNFICPLSDLKLIKKIDRDTYERNRPKLKNINYLCVYYLLLRLSEDRDAINIDDLIKMENSPAKLLNLDKNLINEYLDEMKKNNMIIINRTAGLNMIYFNQKKVLSEIIGEYFE